MRLAPPLSRFALLCALAAALHLQAAPHQGPAQEPAPPAAADNYTLTLPAGAGAPAEGGTVQFIGTATVLIRYQGLTILTDPNFLHRGDHVHLGYGLTAERLTNPAIELDALPPVDLVILSHMHEDHFDRLVQEKLRREVPIVTTVDASERLGQLGFTHRYALERWDSVTVRKGNARLRITALPGRHGPRGFAVLMPAVIGTMLDFSDSPAGAAYRIYISGDTLVYDDIAEIPRRFPDVDLALLHLGGTRILRLVKVTMDGEDGARMIQVIAPQRAIPIHYNDYDIFRSPLSDFERAVRSAGLEGKVIYLKHGESYGFAPAPRPARAQ